MVAKKELGEDNIYCRLQVGYSPLLKEAGPGAEDRTMEAGTKAEVMKECRLLAHLGFLAAKTYCLGMTPSKEEWALLSQ